MNASLRGILGLVGLTVVLSGCSLVQAVLPDQEVTVADPLGLDGVVVTAAFIGSTSLSAGTIGAQQAGVELVGSLPAVQVPEIDTTEFRGFSPVSLSADVGFRATAEIHSPSATDASQLGATLSFTFSALRTIAIDDGSGDGPVSYGPFATPSGVTVTVTQDTCLTTSAGVTCSYDLSGALEDFVMPAVFTGGDLADLVAILSNDVTPNDLSGTLDLTVDGTIPPDVEVTITLDSATGTIVF